MSEHEFNELIEKIKNEDFPVIMKSIGETTKDLLTELKQKGIGGDQLAVSLCTAAASQAAFTMAVTILAKVYNVKPDPDDPRKYIKLVQ